MFKTYVNPFVDDKDHALYIVGTHLEYENMEDKGITGDYAQTTKAVTTTPPPGLDIQRMMSINLD